MDALIDTVLSRLAYASLQAVLLGALVGVACRFIPSLSAAARSALWWLLGAQLLIGLLAPSPVTLPLLPPAVTTTVVVTAPVIVTAAPDASDVATSTFSWAALLLAAWAAAVLAQWIVAARRGYRLVGIVKRALPHDDVRVETLCARRARELGLRRSPRLKVSDEVDSPQVAGLWRPTILLPLDDRLNDDELDMALMHELAHVRRGDLLLGWVPVLARSLFFFHPIVHLAMREYALCREAACDALVVARGRQAPQTYGRLLLRLGIAPHPHHALPGASPTFRTLKRRLDMLGNATDAPHRALTVAIFAVLTVVGVTPWRVVAAEQGTKRTGVFASPSPAPAPSPAAPAEPAAPAAPAAPAPHPNLSPTPAAPAAPLAARPAGPPPAPPAPPMTSSFFTGDWNSDGNQAFVFFSNDIQVMNGSNADVRRAAAQKKGSGDFAWYQDGKQAWIVRDPAYVKRIHDVYARSSKAADVTAASAEKQASIAQRQAMLNEQMAKLAERQAELAVKQSDPSGPHDPSAYAAGHAAIGKEQAEIGRQLAELDSQNAAEGKLMADRNRRQAEESRKAAQEVSAIMAQAIRDHAAEPAR